MKPLTKEDISEEEIVRLCDKFDIWEIDKANIGGEFQRELNKIFEKGKQQEREKWQSAVEMLKEELRIVVNWLEDFVLDMGKDETTNWKQHIRIHRREINKRFKKCFPVFQKQLEKEGENE